MFFYEIEGHMQKLSSFGREKKIWPKTSLRLDMWVPLQLLINNINNNLLIVKYPLIFGHCIRIPSVHRY